MSSGCQAPEEASTLLGLPAGCPGPGRLAGGSAWLVSGLPEVALGHGVAPALGLYTQCMDSVTCLWQP